MAVLLCSNSRVAFLPSESNTFQAFKSKGSHVFANSPVPCQSSAGKMQTLDYSQQAPVHSARYLPHYRHLSHSPSHTHSVTVASLHPKWAKLLSTSGPLNMLLPLTGSLSHPSFLLFSLQVATKGNFLEGRNFLLMCPPPI